MRRTLIAFTLTITPLLGGCQQLNNLATGLSNGLTRLTSPSDSSLSTQELFLQANDTYTTTLEVLLEAGKAGWISKDTLKSYEPIRKAADAALKKMQVSALAGSSTNPLSDFMVAYDEFNAQYKKLLALRQSAKAPSPADPTPPPLPLTRPSVE